MSDRDKAIKTAESIMKYPVECAETINECRLAEAFLAERAKCAVLMEALEKIAGYLRQKYVGTGMPLRSLAPRLINLEVRND